MGASIAEIYAATVHLAANLCVLQSAAIKARLTNSNDDVALARRALIRTVLSLEVVLATLPDDGQELLAALEARSQNRSGNPPASPGEEG